MHGDFSRWDRGGDADFSAVLQQQGRVLLDRDWNDQARLTLHWQDEAARDVIGAGVAAAAARNADALRVVAARVQDGRVVVTLRPGTLWADGLPVGLAADPDEGEGTIDVPADYLDASVQATPGAVATIKAGVRDVVVLEAWREAVSAFQLPDELLEPALGGPDTTERARTAWRLRLARLANASDDCRSVSLTDQTRGRLRAALRPVSTVDGDCPVTDEGGYVGFEHQLYRVEIADSDAAGACFKWSRFNGGLVARAAVHLGDPADQRFMLSANTLPVQTAGRTDFYLEVVARDDARSPWRVVYGADVTLDGGDLRVVTARFGAASQPADTTGPDSPGAFIRLWDGVAPVASYPASATPAELERGILLEFPDAPPSYRPGDYWTFPVRAAGIPSPGQQADGTLVDTLAPQGVRYHRVPLAEVTWPGEGDAAAVKEDAIEDCRRVFRPLTARDGCCTFTVGDGVQTHGDFDAIEEAVLHLPPAGGRICVLPGDHRANVRIVGRTEVEIAGCGERTRITPREGQEREPIVLIALSYGVRLRALTLLTPQGTAVRIDDAALRGREAAPPVAGPSVTAAASRAASTRIAVEHNRILAGVYAIEARPDDSAAGDNDVAIVHNQIGLLDTSSGRAAVLVSADGVLVERNRVVVVPDYDPDDPADPRAPDTPHDPTFDPCDTGSFYASSFDRRWYAASTFRYITAVGEAPRARYTALGGIQVVGGSERVRILANEVVGGRGHAISLGELPALNARRRTRQPSEFFVADVPERARGDLEQQFVSTVYDVEIDQNVLRDVGMCGVGVAAFFEPSRVGLAVRADGLVISRNRIVRCVRDPEPIPAALAQYAALGGIVLADCSGATVRGNRIEENGADTDEPVCGIFVLNGDRIEVVENAIERNGPRDAGARRLRPGWRAGIAVAFAIARVSSSPAAGGNGTALDVANRDGLPAVRVRGNVVAHAIGQALIVIAIGPVAVTDNSLTALDVDNVAATFGAYAGAVFVFGLGLSRDLLSMIPKFASLANTAAAATPVGDGAALTTLRALPPGGVLVANNQVTLDLRAVAVSAALCSVLVGSFDDVGFSGNQCACVSDKDDAVLFDTFLAGVTVRASDNRLQEGGMAIGYYSLAATAAMSTVTMNQSTHCLLVTAPPARRLEFGNQVWYGGAVSAGGYLTCAAGGEQTAGKP